MIKAMFTNFGSRREHYLVAGVAILLLLIAGAGLAQRLSQSVPDASTLKVIAALGQAVDNSEADDTFSSDIRSPDGLRPADVHSVQLDLLRRWAHEASRFGEASSYAVHLEDLARQGRAAFVAVRPPASADAYAPYLESLLRLGQAVPATSIEPNGANAYSAYTETLFREARSVSVRAGETAASNDFAYHLDTLRRLGQAASAEQRLPAGADEYSAWLDHLRRLGQAIGAVNSQ